MDPISTYEYDVSVIIVAFNVRDLLRECLQSLLAECARLPPAVRVEILALDNASTDGTSDMVTAEFSNSPVPVRLMRVEVNRGFAGGNNFVMEKAVGRYFVLLNTDAFFHEGAFGRAIEHMEANPDVGAAGARLVGRDGSWQPSARAFPSIWNDLLTATGLAARFSKSRIFGAPDRTWADPNEPADVDWVPGCFLIVRRDILVKIGTFDPAFFIYVEEVDLCRRIKAAGHRVYYWPDVVVTHYGGETTKKMRSVTFSKSGSQVSLWRMRSTLLYYRKHHGLQVWLSRWLEVALYTVRRIRNSGSADPVRQERAREAAQFVALMRQAWQETQGGRISPPPPWK